MKKGTFLIILKTVIVGALIWYLPTKVADNTKVIQASTIASTKTPKDEEVAKVAANGKKVYIYNTHQGEQYVSFNVVEGAHYLKQSLEQKGYQCDVESNDFEQYKSAHSITYDKSYTVSKMYLEQSLSNHGNYDLIIDFHRDSIDKNLSTITHGDKNYAKIMFVVGKSSGKFEKVNQMSEDLSNRANAIVPKISRGVYVKQSHYNQGTSDNMVLIEVGAQSNTKEEIMNTVDVLSATIDGYLGG